MIRIGRKYLFFATAADNDLSNSLVAGICSIIKNFSKEIYGTNFVIEFMKGPPPIVLGPSKKIQIFHKDHLYPINRKNSHIFMKWVFN